MARTTYTIHGDILETDSGQLAQILDSRSWQVRFGNGDEIQLRSDNLDMAIYADRKGRTHGWSYLVSGARDGEPEEVRATLEEIAGLLAARGLLYNFEFSEDGSADDEQIVRHPDF